MRVCERLQRDGPFRRDGRRGGELHHDGDAVRRLVREVALQEIVASSRLDVLRQDTDVGRRQTDVEERHPHHEKRGQRGQQEKQRAAHHPEGRAVPHPVAARTRQRQATGVDAVAEDRQEGGEEREGEDDGEPDDDDAADSHRMQVRALEEEQPREARRDGDPRESDDTARRPHGPHERRLQLLARRELLAVAAHDEERIVDGDSQCR